MQCSKCLNEMPDERAELFSTCVNCTPQKKIIGFMDYDCDEIGTICMIRPDEDEKLRLAKSYFHVDSDS